MSQTDNIPKTISQYKTMEQLQEFATAQMATITQLSKKIQKLEEERDHLKKFGPTQPADLKLTGFTENDAELICNMEIGKLREISLLRELTYEETKKLEIYFKVLTQAKNRPKPEEKEAEKLSDDELLTLVQSNANNGK